jgi:hypothetical protein
MWGLISSVVGSVTLVAGAMVGIESVTDAVDVAVVDSNVVSDVAEWLQQVNHGAGDISAQIGNTIGLDSYLGVQDGSLKGNDFYDGLGIIDDTVVATVGYVPQVYQAVVDNPLPAVGGAVAAGALMSIDTGIPIGLHNAGEKTVINVRNLASRAQTMAQDTATTARSTAQNVGTVLHTTADAVQTGAHTIQAGVTKVGDGLHSAGNFIAKASGNGAPQSQPHDPPAASTRIQTASTASHGGRVDDRRIIGANMGAAPA